MTKTHHPPHPNPNRKLDDAKPRFSERVSPARSEDPQPATVHGQDADMVISVEDLERLTPPNHSIPLIPFLESLHLEGLDPQRAPDHGRDPTL